MQVYDGTVQSGGKAAGKLGFPTANIALADTEVSGIYAARVRIVGDREYASVVYANQKRKLLEAHLFDFSGVLYGKRIEIVLLAKIRDDAVFPDEASARRTIAQDVEAARQYFKMKM